MMDETASRNERIERRVAQLRTSSESLLRKCKFQRDMLDFLESAVRDGAVIQAATVIKSLVETAGDIAYEAGRYNQSLLGQYDKRLDS